MIVFIDLETTGADKKKDRIIEISVIKLSSFSFGYLRYLLTGELSTETMEMKTVRVNPGIVIPAGASAVHGITDEDVKDKPLFKNIAKALYEFIFGCDIAGFNSNSFDIPLLYAEFLRAGIVWDYSNINFIDVCNIYKRKQERNLAAAYQHYFGKDLKSAHSAQADVLATMEILHEQMGQYPDLPQTIKELALYSNFDRPRYDIDNVFSKDDSGDWIFNKGKHKGLKAKFYLDYLSWMVREETFFPDAKEIARTIMGNVKIEP